MSLSCECPDLYDCEWAYLHPKDFVKYKFGRISKCSSCKKSIKRGDLYLEFERERLPEEGEDEYDDWVPMSSLFMCEDCGEIYMNLSDIGYCLSPDDDMRENMKEYHYLTGFKK